MYGLLQLNGHKIAVVLLAVSLGTLPSALWAESGNGTDAEISTAGQLEDHEASSGNLDDMTAESQDPDDMVVDSESMDGREAEAANPASMVTVAEDMDQHEATSENLTNLGEDRPDTGFVEIEVPGQAEWEATTDPQILIARENLVRAQKRARAARTAYGDAQQRNYPRGAARIRIVDERDAAMNALEEAKRELAAVE